MALYKGNTKLSGTGDGFHPGTSGSVGDVLKKTAGGYDWDVEIQSDWNQTNQSAPDYIKNKPVVDSSLDTGSTNAIQNGAVATAVNSITGDITTLQNSISSLTTNENTKTFYLSGTTGQANLDAAQAAYDWYKAGKNPIVVYGDAAYILYDVISGQIVFRSTIMGVFDDDNVGYSSHRIRKLSFTIPLDTVTNIVADYSAVPGDFLRTGKNYTTPYTPEYSGSPATKKYVDDIVGNIETLLANI